MIIVVPLVTVPEANRRDHWSVKGKRARAQRDAVAWMFRASQFKPPATGGRYAVTLTRVCPARNAIRDRDNLVSSQKHVRDEVALQLGVDDADLAADAACEWTYRQIVDPRRFAVVIEIESRR